MTQPLFNADQLAQFEENGYVIVKNLIARDELDLLIDWAQQKPDVEGEALARRDSAGGITRLRVWNEQTDDPYGLLARSGRVVDRMTQLLQGEVYFYHAKLNLKEPFTGGAWEWHQDYGYWYNNGCLYPYMASCLMALDANTKENGCLQVIRGSHLLGRIDHGKVGDQTGADPERVEKALERLPLDYCEMEAGSGVFFHCNLLHRSDQNRSPNRRWSFICCYNAARNNPYKEHHHPCYHPLKRVDDDQLRQWQAQQPA